LVVGRDCNALIIADAVTKEALLIDPGGDSETIKRWISKLEVKVVQILVTHAHFDHILAADQIRKALRCPVWLHSKDLTLWRQLPEQMALLGMKRRGARCVKRLCDPDHFLEDGTKLKVLDGVTIHTPGHTSGSVCFYFPSYDLLISGDTLFKSHVGRTDLPGGDPISLRRSVFYKLYKLPHETRVLPGHGKETTIGYEMKNNRSCRVCTCKPLKKSVSYDSKFSQLDMSTSNNKHSINCPTSNNGKPIHCHTSGNKENDNKNGHTTISDGDCCEEADEDDEHQEEAEHICTCGAKTIPGKHQHIGEDMCSVL